MIVSILVATRKRLGRLARTLHSIYETASLDNFEILLRADDDDLETVGSLPSIVKKYQQVKYIVGPRYDGYASHPVFMDELASIAKGEWCFFLDDDSTIIGKGWDEQLKDVPKTGKIVHPEFYQLGPSKYGSGSCVPVAICVPTRCWLTLGWDKMVFPIDASLQSLLESHGWENHFLTGITSYHDRDNGDQLAQHRML
jgi:hypothetical protein